MPHSLTAPAEQKEETKEKMAGIPTLEQTVSLRDCVKRISTVRPGKSSSEAAI
jgi:hypothetical protein